MSALRRHIGQLRQYQYLHDTVWGLLTDGERWILLRNDQEVHVFANLREMRSHLRDFQECVGRDAMSRRLGATEGREVLIVSGTEYVRDVVAPHEWTEALSLQAFLMLPTPVGLDATLHLTIQLSEKGYKLFNLASGKRSDPACLGEALFMNALIGAHADILLHGGAMAREDADPADVDKLKGGYPDAARHWVRTYTLLNDAYTHWTRDLKMDFDNLIELCVGTNATVHKDYLTPNALAYIRQHPSGGKVNMVSGMNAHDFLEKVNKGEIGASMSLPGGVRVEIAASSPEEKLGKG